MGKSNAIVWGIASGGTMLARSKLSSEASGSLGGGNAASEQAAELTIPSARRL
jgi:hypothetical protein